ncbi:dicarboxylate/amino acid:cation symporter [Novosphingobium sp. Fuku2-ISO-50]|uniref:dicarboxylate/amino acid:cation symporter n=1 Tax=Novosphingobium sp. Fuku2-ISO-50 TaxID=1739114 RepID=UPI0009EAA9CE|nr:dicarboxylate/amino acid:cation symporter [Novosphingobium sp. Fuku2-ISO-50]
MARRLTLWIVIGMFAGIALGAGLHQALPADSKTLATTADLLKLLPEVFLRLIKMIIAPLILATLVTGIAAMGDSSALGRIGGRALGWFVCASLISITLGLVLVNLFQPGHGLHFTAAAPVGTLSTADFTFRHFVMEIVPTSVIDAMAQNNVLQILVFALFAGVALSALGETGAPLVRGAEALVAMMLTMTGYVMRAAPLAVFGALASVIATRGLGILVTYGAFVAEFYGGLALFWLLLFSVASLFLGRRAWLLARYVREPLLLAYSTASSESALPRLFEALDRFGVPRRISGFVLPLGYSFNLDGSMMYTSFATMFIAQAYGIPLSAGQQVAMLLTLMITSKGIAGVPRASLVVIAATLTQFGLPIEGIALLLGVDTFLDMGRTATNVVGNAVATAVITHWEGMLQVPLDPDAPIPMPPHDTPEHGRRGLHLDPGA